MKSIEELKALREKARKSVELRDTDKDYRVVVGMATCGIASGARPVLNTLVEECAKDDYNCVVTQTGCIGMCTLEPIVEVYDKNQIKTTYCKVTPEIAKLILKEHIAQGNTIEQYTVANHKK